MALVLALLAATGWGSSDYAAGVATRRSSALSVVVLVHGAAAVLLGAVVVVVDLWHQSGIAVQVLDSGAAAPARLSVELLLPSRGLQPASPTDLGWGAAGGISGGFGALLLFQGLSRGTMSVIAPITAVVAALVPVVAGLMTGEQLGALGVAAVALALLAVVLVTETPSTSARHALRGGPGRQVLRALGRWRRPRTTGPARRRLETSGASWARWPARFGQAGVPEALASGLGFGGFYLLLGRTGETAALWPVLSARTASALLFLGVAVLVRERVLPRRADRRVVLAAGGLDALAAAMFLAATREGMLSVVAVVASLYPAATIGLARLLDAERCSRRQVAGLGLAAVSVGVLALS